jgi:ketosteroid isomerase-like protein
MSLYIQLMMMAQDSEHTLQVAHQAFEQFTYGLATGEWQAFLDMLTDDFTFWFPLGKYQGLNLGKERAKEFFQYVSACFRPGIQLTSLDCVTSNKTTVVFQFQDEGLLFGQPYKNRVAVAFDVRGDKICGYREYFGSDGKSY